MAAKYRLRMNISIMQVDEHGQYMGQLGGNLQVSEDIDFEAANFLEIAAVLGRFHEVSQEIKQVTPGG